MGGARRRKLNKTDETKVADELNENHQSEAKPEASEGVIFPELREWEADALQEILKIGGLAPDKLGRLSRGLDKVHLSYLVGKRIEIHKETRKAFGDISARSSKLIATLDKSSPPGSGVEIWLAIFGAKSNKKLKKRLHLLQKAADGAYAYLVPPRLSKQSLTTCLFIGLRGLFISLGGKKEIGVGTQLYKFVSACVQMIDRTLQIPEPESFRVLLTTALKRRRLRGRPV